MGAVIELPTEKERMATPIYADILGKPHDTLELAHEASFDWLLAREMREIHGIPDSPVDSREKIALEWLAENRETASELLTVARERLKQRGVEESPAIIALPR